MLLPASKSGSSMGNLAGVMFDRAKARSSYDADTPSQQSHRRTTTTPVPPRLKRSPRERLA